MINIVHNIIMIAEFSAVLALFSSILLDDFYVYVCGIGIFGVVTLIYVSYRVYVRCNNGVECGGFEDEGSKKN